MRTSQRYHVGIGMPSILMIFVVLCLTTFGVLSYSSANADYKLTVKHEEYMNEYYQADAKAQEILMEIDDILYEAGDGVTDDRTYRNNILSLLSVVEYETAKIEVYESEDASPSSIELTCSIDLNEQHTLQVILSVLPFNSQKRYEILSYQVLQEDVWGITIEEETAGLWQGGA